MPQHHNVHILGVGALPPTLLRHPATRQLTLTPTLTPTLMPAAMRALAHQFQPDLVLLGHAGSLRETRGQLQLLTQHWEDLPVVIFSREPSLEEAYALFAAGARGYLEWNASHTKIESAITCILEGGYVCGITLTNGLRSSALSGLPYEREETYELTPQELTLVTMIAEHQTNESIAELLGLAEKTVEYHMRNLFKKLGVRSRKEIGAWWVGRIKASVAEYTN